MTGPVGRPANGAEGNHAGPEDVGGGPGGVLTTEGKLGLREAVTNGGNESPPSAAARGGGRAAAAPSPTQGTATPLMEGGDSRGSREGAPPAEIPCVPSHASSLAPSPFKPPDAAAPAAGGGEPAGVGDEAWRDVEGPSSHVVDDSGTDDGGSMRFGRSRRGGSFGEQGEGEEGEGEGEDGSSEGGDGDEGSGEEEDGLKPFSHIIREFERLTSGKDNAYLDFYLWKQQGVGLQILP